MRLLRLGEVRILIWPERPYVRTVFPDGAVVHAVPEDTEEQRETARELGYPSDRELTIEHDSCHSLLAHLRGLPYSPVLWAVAHGLPEPPGAGDEERDVLALQRWMNRPEAECPEEWREVRTEALRMVRGERDGRA